MSNFQLEKLADRTIKWVGSTASIIVHSIIFLAVFLAGFLGIDWGQILLVLTTVVSLEAIYLAIFIQMSVNRTHQSLRAVEANIDEIQEDVDEIQEDVGEIQEDVDEIQEDVGEIQEEENNEEVEEKTLDEIKNELTRLTQNVEKLSQLQHLQHNANKDLNHR